LRIQIDDAIDKKKTKFNNYRKIFITILNIVDNP
jgi:hypothetical protein